MTNTTDNQNTCATTTCCPRRCPAWLGVVGRVLAFIALAIMTLAGLTALFDGGTDVTRLCGILVLQCVWIVALLCRIACNTTK